MSASSVLQRARETLATANLGLEDLGSLDPGRRGAGIRNVLVWGRAVTNVLQNLRSEAEDFDAWYSPWKTEMGDDPLLRFVYKLRSIVLKQGTLATSNHTYISSFSTSEIPPAPQGATAFFMGDQTGGNGWTVVRGGVTEKIYVSLPPEKVRSWLELADTPDTHLGEPLTDRSVQAIGSRYLEYLERLLVDAEKHFG